MKANADSQPQPELYLGTIRLSTTAPEFSTEQLPTQQTKILNSTLLPIEPMKPMQPMTLGNMQMNLKPMKMKIGDMEMRMGFSVGSVNAATPAPTRQFCTQCGASINPSDRFCASCGHQIT